MPRRKALPVLWVVLDLPTSLHFTCALLGYVLCCLSAKLIICIPYVCSITSCVTRGQSQQAQVNTTSYMTMEHTSVEAVAHPCTSELSFQISSCSRVFERAGR